MVVWKLDWLARSTRDLLEIMAAIQAAGAGFRSLSEPWADTTSHAGKLMMTIFAGIAEFERALILERTSVGRTAARERGVRFGRPPKFNAEQQRLALRLIEEGKSVGEVARTFGVHPATVYRLTPAVAPERYTSRRTMRRINRLKGICGIIRRSYRHPRLCAALCLHAQAAHGHCDSFSIQPTSA